MAGEQPAPGSAGETMAQFAARQNRLQANAALRAKQAHEDYGRKIRAETDAGQSQPSTQGMQQPGPQAQDDATEVHPAGYVGHPGFAESLIPVWGSGREAVADFQDGDYAGAALNGAAAASDLFIADSLANVTRKVAAKGSEGGLEFLVKGRLGKSTKWKSVRPDMTKHGVLEKGQDGHHWLFPQRWDWVPEFIRNHPLNIQGMPSREVHMRLDRRYLGKPQFNRPEAYWRGTPHWSKALTGSVAMHTAGAIEQEKK